MPRVKTVQKARASERARRCHRCGVEIVAGDRYYVGEWTDEARTAAQDAVDSAECY